MKLSAAHQLLLPLALFSTAEARHAHIYTSNLSTQPWSDALSFSTVRSILAQHLGVSQYHSLEDVDDVAMRALNALGPQQRTLFGEELDETSPRSHAIVVVEGAENVDGLDADDSSASFTAASPPSVDSTRRFLKDLGLQYEDAHDTPEHGCRARSKSIGKASSKEVEWQHTQDHGCLTVMHGQVSESFKRNGDAKHMLSTLKQLSKSDESLTVIFVQPTSSSLFKRADTGAWGKYVQPASDPPVDAEVEAEAIEVERPAVERPDARPTSTKRASSARSTSRVSEPTKAPMTPPRGILPACYANEASCNEITHNCSGHGSCKLKYDTSGRKSNNPERRADNDGGNTQCWACACENEVAKTPGGLARTTRWAGPACQKQDVSESFWLLAGAGIALAALVAWAVGLLVSMGEQELPSVIGAGVAGPRAK